MLQSGKGATKSSIALDEASLFASAGGPSAASLVLCSSMASLGMAGNNLSLTTSGAVFTFGSTALKLDAMGLSMGSAFTILNPGPPGLMYSGLQKTLQKVTKLNAEMALQRKAFELLQMKQEALEAANKKLNEALVAARNQVNAATQTSVSQ